MDQNLLPQVKNLTRIKIYSWWNTDIRSEKLLVYYFVSRNQNYQYKEGIFFLESKTEDTELQGSVAASEVSSWNS